MRPLVQATGIELFAEAAAALEVAASACEDPTDAAGFADLAGRVRAYLATSRSTTPLGMPHILSGPNQLDDEMVVHRTGPDRPSHVRIVERQQ